MTDMGRRCRRPKNVEFCAYCGVRPGTTREHVVPRSLFPKPLPEFMVTVGVCSRCNGDKSPLDAYLRDVLVADLASSDNPAANAVRSGTMLRSIQTNRSDLARAARSDLRMEPLHTPAGIFLGYHPSF